MRRFIYRLSALAVEISGDYIEVGNPHQAVPIDIGQTPGISRPYRLSEIGHDVVDVSADPLRCRALHFHPRRRSPSHRRLAGSPYPALRPPHRSDLRRIERFQDALPAADNIRRDSCLHARLAGSVQPELTAGESYRPRPPSPVYPSACYPNRWRRKRASPRWTHSCCDREVET